MAGRLSRVQGANWREAFDVADKDGDGALSGVDVQFMFQQLGEMYTVEACEAAVAKYDTLGTGKLDFTEYLTMMALRTKRAVVEKDLLTAEEDEKQARDTFRRLTRGEDTLSLDAFKRVLEELGEDGQYDAERTFSAVTHNSARMTFEQFRAALREGEM